ncbi:MAG: NuoF family protein [bacterium]
MKIGSSNELKEYREKIVSSRNLQKTTISICNGAGCLALGAKRLSELFESEVKKRNLDIEILKTGCPGFCEKGPLLTILPQDIFYSKITSEDVSLIIEETIIKGKVIDKLLYEDPNTKEKIIKTSDIPFYKKQTRRLLSLNGKIDPTNISHYIQYNGYSALSLALFIPQNEIIEEVKKSGLRGRGGGGFPTGMKWEFLRKEKSPVKYIICNADEGDPGAFMDRALMEGNPHLILEGMIIGGYATGAKEGFVYVRTEYPLALKHITIAIKEGEKLGFLGENILGSGFSFKIKVREGAGAFVCGEETALIASIEGKRGMPRPRPSYPIKSGLFGKPTLINNVETFANIPYIIQNGGDNYAKIGTKTSKGTKIFALAGKVKHTGLVEVAMGTTLREIIFEIGGGILGEREFKAVQLGGPSGGCLSSKDLDIGVDYESLISKGAIMGSGGMIVMDETNCMVELARFFMEFVQNESCGKCVPCRIGTKKMLDILTRLTKGKGKQEDILELKRLAKLIKESSLCGLGQTAPNPVLSTIENFPEDYRVHIEEKFCPLCKSKGVFPVRHWSFSKPEEPKKE